MRVLGLESSCDETAAAVVEDGVRALSDVVASQHDVHRPYGGVVPELASRAHVVNVVPVLDQALVQAGVQGWSARSWWRCRPPRRWRGPAASR